MYVKLNRKVQILEIINLSEYSTKNLTFEFDGKYYKEINGIPMGSPLAPIAAEIYMKDFENNLLMKNPQIKIMYYYRYVNDLFLIILKSVYENQLLNVINNLDTNLKFTLELESNDSLNFSDVRIFKNNKNLLTKWFRKAPSTLTFQQWN